MISTVKEGLKVANVADVQHSAEFPMKNWEDVTIGLQDSRAAKSLIELESHIKEEEETLEEIQKNSATHLISQGSAGLSHCKRKFDDRKLAMMVKLCPMPELIKIQD